MAAKLTRLTQKIAIQLHLLAESCTICSSCSRRPVRNLSVHPRKGGWDERGLWHSWKIWEMNTQLWSGNLKERDHS